MASTGSLAAQAAPAASASVAAAAAAAAPDFVDITRDNFEEVLPMVEKALKECSFFALDCEMTGLFLNDNKEEFLDDAQDRYSKLTQSAHKYVINQFGLSVFTPQPGGSNCYKAHTFNFYVFPHTTESDPTVKFVSDAGALTFLASQGFDFNKWIYKGVPYLNLREKERRMLQISRSETDVRNEVIPTKEDDIKFAADVVERVKTWMAQDDDPMMMLPQVNSYQRLLALQELCKPQFGVEGRTGFYVQKVNVNGWTRLQITKGSEEEVKVMAAEDKKLKLRALNDAVGFSRVLELMRSSGKPAVGHNCFFDILYVLASFAEPSLPNEWSDFKRLVGKWFPKGIYDTKHLARMLPELFGDQGSSTSLGEVYKGMTKEGPQRERAQKMIAELARLTDQPICMPEIQHAEGFEKYKEMEAGSAAHEAGYDAFMTASAFACLMPLVHAKLVLPIYGGAFEASNSSTADTAADGTANGTANGTVDSTANGTAEGIADDTAAPSGQGDWDMQMYNPWDYVTQFVGRLNIGKSDMPYLSLCGSDPVLQRPNVFHLSGLPPGTRSGDVMRRMQAAELGRVRVSMLSPSSAYIEVDSSMKEFVVQRIGDAQRSDIASAAVKASGRDAPFTVDIWNTTPIEVITFEAFAKLKSAEASSRVRGVGQATTNCNDTVYGQRPTKRVRAGEEEQAKQVDIV